MEYLLVVGIAQCLFAGLMIATKKPQQLPDRFLAALMFLVAIEMSIYLIKSLFNVTLANIFTTDPVPFTYGPLLLLYTQSMINEKFRFRWYYWLHFIPFVAFFIFSLVLVNKPVVPTDLSRFLLADRFQTHRIVFGVWFFISIITYGIIIFVLIARHQRKIKDLFSYKSERINLQWLKVLSITFYVAYNIVFITASLNVFDLFNAFDPLTFSFAGLTFMAFAISFYGIRQPLIFNNRNATSQDHMPEEISPEPDRSSMYEKSGLMPEDIDRIRQTIEKYFQDEKPFLNGDLTLQDVASQLNIPKHHLTQVFNMGIGKNFYTYVNDFRLAEVKNRLKDQAYRNFSLLAIAFDSGFNSKTSFNTLFKKYTGLTPSEYQRKFFGNKQDQKNSSG
jgi:AraC-like DNA-binding protein